MSGSPTLVLVHLGPQLPSYLAVAVRQARIFNDCRVIVVAEATALAGVAVPGAEAVAIEDLGPSDRDEACRELTGRSGAFLGRALWRHSIRRFFVLENLVAGGGLANVVHIENDVMLYADLPRLVPKLASVCPGLGVVCPNDHLAVASFLYVPGPAVLTALTDFILAQLAAAARDSTAPVKSNDLNDMVLLSRFKALGPAAADNLPIAPPDYPAPLTTTRGRKPADPTPYSRHFAALGTIFDASALGQYLGGIDPRNDPGPTVGFVNWRSYVDPRVLKVRMSADAAGRRVPVVETPSGIWPVANLHIHSKNPEPFLSA